jgi:enediyne biosynthesis protein E4
MMNLLAPLLLLPQSVGLHVSGPDGPELISHVRSGDSRLLLPAHSLSEQVTRAIPGRHGIELFVSGCSRLAAKELSLVPRAIQHPKGTRLMVFGEELRILRDESLPENAWNTNAGTPILGLVARQDGVAFRNGTISISAGPEGSDLVLIPLAQDSAIWRLEARAPGGEWAELQANGLPGHAVRLDGSSPWELKVGFEGLDQAFHTRSATYAQAEEELHPSSLRHFEVSEERAAFHSTTGFQCTGQHPFGKPTAEWNPNSPERLLNQGELLRARYKYSEGRSDDQTWTLLVDVHLEIPTDNMSVLDPNESGESLHFSDWSEHAGVHGVHLEGPSLQLDIRPTMGPGAAWGDVDGDGLPDLYFVQGGGREGSNVPPNKLMRNLGNGKFEPLPAAADTGAGMGALFFDLEGDGDLDLYVANYGPDKLYRGDGKGGFEDISAEHQLAGDGWSAGLCAADYDRDGDIDLYITSYLVYDPALMPPVEELPGYSREDPTEMLPFAFPGAKNHFLENVDGKLVDRTEELGLVDEQGRGMQPVFWDFDKDGDPDLYIANDVSPNVLFRNEGDGTFKDISFQVGMDDPRGGMGVATGDVDSDGDSDLFLTNWELEANAMYRNNLISKRGRKLHTGSFQDVTVYSRLSRDSVGTTSWGAVFFDADNDGDLDLFVPNGYTSPDYESTGICVGQPNQFFLNDGTGRFVDVSAESGKAVLAHYASRAVAVCDYDRDGRLDLLVTNNNGPYQLLRNEMPSKGSWIGLRLKGAGTLPTAIGARVELEVDGRLLSRELQAGSGYLAGHANEVHFGLGEYEELGDLNVWWPDGTTSSYEVSKVGAWVTLEQPEDS